MASILLTYIMIANPGKRKFLNIYISTYGDHARYNQQGYTILYDYHRQVFIILNSYLLEI